MHWRSVCKLLCCFLIISSSTAFGGGFEFPDIGTRAVSRGGAFAVLADDLTAMAHNPGGLIRGEGTRILYNHNLVWAPMLFERQNSQIGDVPDGSPDDPLAGSENQNPLFPLGATFLVGSDFGLDNWAFALGVFGPSAVGKKDFPVQGGQRYLMTSSDLLVYYTASIAYGIKDTFGVGVSLQYVHTPHVRFGLVVDAVPPPSQGLSPYYSSFDLEANLDMSDDFSFAAIIGGWWRVLPQLELGLSSRVAPVPLNLEGTLELNQVPGSISTENITLRDSSVSMDLALPVVVRGGLRYRHPDAEDNEIFDIEANVVWENWSVLESYDTKLNGSVTLEGVLPEQALPDIEIPRAWRDTFSVRLGGTYNPIPKMLGLSLGGFWERGATPENYEHLDFPSFDRLGVGGGLRLSYSGVDFNVSYMHIFQETRETKEINAKIFQTRPLNECPDGCADFDGVPANAGKYTSSYDVLSLGVSVHPEEWF